MGHQYPHRLPQRPGEMSDAGIHRDDEIQLRYELRSGGKIFKFIAEMKNVATLPEQR
jgi:hypothetical protein